MAKPRKPKTKPKTKRPNGSGSITRLNDERYRWRVTVGLRPDGHAIQKSGVSRTHAEAEQAIMAVLVDLSRGTLPAPDRVTVREWLDRWLAGKKPSLAVKTHHNYEQVIERHIVPHIGRKRLQALRPVDLHGLYTALTEKGVVDTQRQAHNILHAAFAEAVRLDLIVRNPSDVIRPTPPRRTIDESESKALTAEETAKLLPVLRSDRWGLPFEFMLATGLRRAEVCGLRWDDVDLENGRLHFKRNRITVAGQPVEGPVKTRSRLRPLYLSPGAVDILKRQAEQQAFERAALGPGPVKGHAKTYERKRVWVDSGHVFTALYGAPLHPDRLRSHLIRLAKEAGVRHVTNHAMRHTHASLMLRRGVPLEVVSRKLGHAKPSFTADVYRHVYEDEHEEWALDLSDLVAKKGG